MHEIEVTFPSPSGTSPVVTQMLQRGRSDDMIVWDVICCDPKVKFIDIEFKEPAALFFRESKGKGTPDTNRIVKEMKKGRCRMQIYGHAPAYQGKRAPVQDKYTIRGWDDQGGKPGKMIAELDPLWVTDKP